MNDAIPQREKQDVLNPDYWRKRVSQAPAESPHHAIFKCNGTLWDEIARMHERILCQHIGPRDDILDVGCGWGRLLYDLLPEYWQGSYLGVDIADVFIERANAKLDWARDHPDDFKKKNPARYRNASFFCGPLDTVKLPDKWADWAILISVRPMLIRNTGVWPSLQAETHRRAKRVLYLEYDPNDPGSIETMDMSGT